MHAVWCLFVQYPNKDPVCREIVASKSLAELREALQVFDDQHLLVADWQGSTATSGSNGPNSAAAAATPAAFAQVDRVEQLYDGAVLRVTVPRRQVFVNLGAAVRNKPIIWYPGASAEQIECAIVKACGLPLGTPIEILNGEDALVISATIPNDSVLTVMPLLDAASANGHLASRQGVDSPGSKRRERRPSNTPTVPRASSTNRGAGSSPVLRGAPLTQRSRSATPGGHSGVGAAAANMLANRSAELTAPQGMGTPGGSSSGVGRTSPTEKRPNSPMRDNTGAVDLNQPSGRVSAPDEHCVHILAGHVGFVLCLCTVGDVLFTGSQDCNIMIWDLNNLQYIGTLPGHRGFVKCMVATLPRKMLCSGSQDRTIKVWSLETFSATKTLMGHTSEVNALSVLESNDVLISGAEDRTIRIWDLSTLSQIAGLEQAHASGVFALAQLDGGLFLSASRDRTVKVWLTSTWQARRTLSPPHYDSVSDLTVGLRNGRFYSVSRDRSIRRWDNRSFESDLQLTHAHGDWLTSVALSPSEETLFSGSKDCVVKVWDSDLHCKDLLLGHRGAISALLTIDGHLFSASNDRTVRVWRVDHFEQG